MTTGVRVDEHHGLAVPEVVALLRTDLQRGLGPEQARDRLQRLGPNALPPPRRQGPLVRLALQFHHPLIYVLVVAGLAALSLGERVDAAVILGVVLANAVIGFVQERKAQDALDALDDLVRTRATVLRDGTAHDLPSEQVVPGDVVLLAEGDRVPADLRLGVVDELAVDESALTGESVPVDKQVEPLPVRTVLADRRNMAWSGTLVTRGRARGVVVAHGTDTEIGHVRRLMEAADDLATPLTRDLARFSRILTLVILGLAAAAFVIGVLRGEPVAEMVTAAVALAVAAIPEGLPAVVTITLAIGVTRMARRGAIIRKLPAVETLGSTTVICTDKTGTLTENRQVVRQVVAAGADLDVLVAGALCNDARRGPDGTLLGDPTETALLAAALQAGVDLDEAGRSEPRVATLPFSSARRLMATRHRPAGGGPDVVYVKGAAEAVLARCTAVRTPGGAAALDLPAWSGRVDALARQGLRVLACARALVPGREDRVGEAHLDTASLELLGLEAMADPPRPAAVRSVRACREAGVSVTMVTGDHASTARAIGAEVGVAGPGVVPVVMTGEELAAVPDEQLPAVAEQTDVFARVSPEDKLRLVRALQQRRHVVAMTGDGVNDAPALEQADIGVAMGLGGTEVAREAADMVLTDDDFASIEAAVEEGRGVFDNLVKFLVFALPTNIGQGLVILVAVLVGSTLPLTPVQVLWVNLTSAVLLGLPLAVEVREPGLMSRPPRDVNGPLLQRVHLLRMVLASLLLLVGAFAMFGVLRATGAGVEQARTAAVNLFLLVESGYLLACRSFDRPLREVGLLSNRWVPAGIGAALGLQLLFTYAPFMNVLFDTAPVGPLPWLAGLGYAVVAYALLDGLRLLQRRPPRAEAFTRR